MARDFPEFMDWYREKWGFDPQPVSIWGAALEYAKAEKTAHNSEYKSATPQLNQLRKLLLDQKQLDPEINKLVNENFWDLI